MWKIESAARELTTPIFVFVKLAAICDTKDTLGYHHSMELFKLFRNGVQHWSKNSVRYITLHLSDINVSTGPEKVGCETATRKHPTVPLPIVYVLFENWISRDLTGDKGVVRNIEYIWLIWWRLWAKNAYKRYILNFVCENILAQYSHYGCSIITLNWITFSENASQLTWCT